MKTILTILICSISYFSVYSQQPPPPSQEEVYQVVEDMPRFPGCEEERKEGKRNNCASKKLLEFLYTNIKYPAEARRDTVEGTVVVQYVVEKDGSISEVKIAKSVGGGCDEEVLRVVSLMPIWVPGRQSGTTVRVRYTLPVKFRFN